MSEWDPVRRICSTDGETFLFDDDVDETVHHSSSLLSISPVAPCR